LFNLLFINLIDKNRQTETKGQTPFIRLKLYREDYEDSFCSNP